MANKNNNKNQDISNAKFLLYIGIIVVALVLMFRSCFGCSSSSNGGEYSYKSNTADSEDYSWIVGTWACDMGAYGLVVVIFDGNGKSGDCTEVQYGSYKYGTYSVDGNTLRYKLNDESVTTTIEIEPGHRLSAGGGYYYHKR